MKKRFIILLVLLTVTLLMMTGCTRSATRAPRVTSTPVSDIPFPVSTQSQIMVDILASTQTANAQVPATVGSAPTNAPATGGAEPTNAPASSGSAPTSVPIPQTTAAPQVQPTAVIYPTATPGVPATYTIQSDEHPYCIARRFNLNIGDLLATNELGVDSYVYPGFVLTLPQNSNFGSGRSLKSHPTEYTVQPGDTVGKIACSFGDVNPYDIYAVNKLEQGSALTPGQVINIP